MSINNDVPNIKGWAINHEFGFRFNSSASLFHDTMDNSKCPETIGFYWHTRDTRNLTDVEVRCLQNSDTAP